MSTWTDIGSLVVAIFAAVLAIGSLVYAHFAYRAARDANSIAEHANRINKDIESGQAGRRQQVRDDLYSLWKSLTDQSRILEYESKVLEEEPAVGKIEGVRGAVSRFRSRMPSIELVREHMKGISHPSIRQEVEYALRACEDQVALIDEAVYASKKMDEAFNAEMRDAAVVGFDRDRRKVWDRLSGLQSSVHAALGILDTADRGELPPPID